MLVDSYGVLAIIDSDEGCHTTIWTDMGLLFIGPLGTHFSEVLIKIREWFQEKAVENVYCKMASLCSGLSVSVHANQWEAITVAAI